MLEVMVVDDEPVARRRLAALLKVMPVRLTGQAGNAEEALALARQDRPDLVLLDIEMPGPSGLDLAAWLRALPDPPAIVFVTAFSRFALAAFDLAASDYLVKPVEPLRLAEAIARVSAQRVARGANARIAELEGLLARLRDADADRGAPAGLWLPDRNGHARVAVAEIDWVAAERDYVRVHAMGRSFLKRGRIGALAVTLAPHGFLRVHRGVLVRAGAVVRIAPRGDRAWRLTLTDGTMIDASRRFAAQLKAALDPRG